jgi:formyl-CoA transferase
MKFSTFTPKITSAPLLGEHTDEVLAELGYSADQIAKLHDEKVVGATGTDETPRRESSRKAG